MRAAGGGRVVMMGSDLTQRTDVRWSACSAAAAAQLTLAFTWAREPAPERNTVNAVVPGRIPAQRHAGLAPGFLVGWTDRVPLRQLRTSATVAFGTGWLTFAGGAFITGEQITVHGEHGLT
ncbi:SDR family oxidoreductase [Nakamurella sp. YIM 132084]|uniref:SDR family oxidoreductase n=1 Tax=Nakamurella leprariae TaxID=2803911 RepID=A0A938YHM1_9ACTN|nr:SDR family oxidoreductase [Nakamurella leprariae]